MVIWKTHQMGVFRFNDLDKRYYPLFSVKNIDRKGNFRVKTSILKVFVTYKNDMSLNELSSRERLLRFTLMRNPESQKI